MFPLDLSTFNNCSWIRKRVGVEVKGFRSPTWKKVTRRSFHHSCHHLLLPMLLISIMNPSSIDRWEMLKTNRMRIRLLALWQLNHGFLFDDSTHFSMLPLPLQPCQTWIWIPLDLSTLGWKPPTTLFRGLKLWRFYGLVQNLSFLWFTCSLFTGCSLSPFPSTDLVQHLRPPSLV